MKGYPSNSDLVGRKKTTDVITIFCELLSKYEDIFIIIANN